MGMSLAPAAWVFLWSVCVGGLLGVCYDVFRIIRIAVPGGKALIFLQDLIFFLIAAIVSFLFLLANNQGVIRGYLLAGELLGFVLYYFTVGSLVYKAASAIINLMKKILRVLLRPFVLLFQFLGRILGKCAKGIGRFFKKSFNNLKNGLQSKAVRVYNHCKCKGKKPQTKRNHPKRKKSKWRRFAQSKRKRT